MANRLLNIAACVIVGLVAVAVGVVFWQQSRQPKDLSEAPALPDPPAKAVAPAEPAGKNTVQRADGQSAPAVPQPAPATQPKQPAAPPPTPPPTGKQAEESPAAPPKPAAPRKGDLTWAEVEARFEAAREARKKVFLSNLGGMYNDVANPAFTDAADYPAHCAELARWRDELPQSPTPLVALAKAHIQYAWEARGSGYAGTVTEEGWRLFHTRIEEAQRLLERAEKLGPQDGQLYRELLVVAMAAGASEEQTRAWFDAGRKVDPGYIPLYLQMAIGKMPRWGGAPGDVERFAAEVTELVPGDDGLELFAQIVFEIHGYECDDPTTILWGEYDRKLLAKSAAVLADRNPSPRGLQFVALCALVSQDHELARKVLPRVGEFNREDRIWAWKNTLDQFKRWAEATELPSGEESTVWASFAGCVGIAFADDSRHLWVGQQFGRRSATLFDTQSGKLRSQIAHPGGVVNEVLFDSQQQRLLLATWNGPLVGWVMLDFGTGEPVVFPTSERILALGLNPKQPQVAWSDSKKVRLLDLTDANRQTKDLEARAFKLVFSPDGTRLAADTVIFDTATGEKVATLPTFATVPRPAQSCEQVLDIDEEGRIWTIAVSAAPPTAAKKPAPSDSKKSGQPAARAAVPMPKRSLIRFSADGLQMEPILPDIGQGRVALSPDRKLLAVTRDTGVNTGPCGIDIFDIPSGQRVKQLGGHWNPIGELTFSPDGKKLASVARMCDIIKIWSLDSTAAAAKE